MKLDNTGFSLMELVVVLGLLAVVMAVLVQFNLAFSENVSAARRQVKANALATETLEALRIIKEKKWDDLGDLTLGDLTTDTSYYLAYSENKRKWLVETQKPSDIDGLFAVSFVVRQVLRDVVTGRIVSSGGAVDSGSLLAQATVSWTEKSIQKSVKINTYLTDY